MKVSPFGDTANLPHGCLHGALWLEPEVRGGIPSPNRRLGSVCHLEDTVGNIRLTMVAELKAEAILGRTEMLAC